MLPKVTNSILHHLQVDRWRRRVGTCKITSPSHLIANKKHRRERNLANWTNWLGNLLLIYAGKIIKQIRIPAYQDEASSLARCTLYLILIQVPARVGL